MKTEEDEAFDDLAKRQGSWGGGFPAKRKMAADKLQEPWNEDEWRRNNWRCGHGWLRGEQCESCNAPQPVQEPVAWALEWTFDGEEKGRRLYDDERHCKLDAENDGGVCRPLVYGDTAPPQRTWIWLSDADIADVTDTTCQYTGGYEEYLIKKAERKIKELNT